MRKPLASETGVVDARDMPASETGAVEVHARDMRQPPRARLHVNSPALHVRHNCPFCRTPDPNKRCQCVSRTDPLFRSCSLLGFALLIWKQPGGTLT